VRIGATNPTFVGRHGAAAGAPAGRRACVGEAGEAVAFGVFDDAEAVAAAERMARPGVAAGAEEEVVVLAGPVALWREAAARPLRRGGGGGDRPLFATAREHDAAPGGDEAAGAALIGERVPPVSWSVAQGPGWPASSATGATPARRVVSANLCDDRRAAMAAHRRVVEVVAARLAQAFPRPPRAAAGATRVVVVAR
jgi:hypothetical protein